MSDKRGRNNRPKGVYAAMTLTLMDTDAWRALKPSAQALYPWIKLEWKGPKFNNNGKIRLPVREAARKMGMYPQAVVGAFHDLQAKGFIVLTEYANLGIEGEGQCPAYEITEIPLSKAAGNSGRQLYEKWDRGKDYPVHKIASNNPTGRNGREKTCHENQHGTVLKFITLDGGAS